MKCNHCSTENEAGFRFCGSCGTPLTKPTQQSPTELGTELALKKCPFCAELIQAAAVKCRYCGEFLTARSTPKQATYVKMALRNNAVYLDSDGDKNELMDLITTAIRNSGGYVLTNVDRDSGLIRFETGNMTVWSFAGEEITASISSTDSGSSAMFIAKTKPSGMFRLSYGVNAGSHVQRLLKHIKIQRV